MNPRICITSTVKIKDKVFNYHIGLCASPMIGDVVSGPLINDIFTPACMHDNLISSVLSVVSVTNLRAMLEYSEITETDISDIETSFFKKMTLNIRIYDHDNPNKLTHKKDFSMTKVTSCDDGMESLNKKIEEICEWIEQSIGV